MMLLFFQQSVTAFDEISGMTLPNDFPQSISLDDDNYALVPYSFGFAILTPTGYFNAEGKFSEYNAPFPEELKEIELKSLKAITLKGKTFLLYPGGGILYTFQLGIIKRIDASFAHRNYHDPHLFIHNNVLYLLGGYGLWTTKNNLLRFNFSSNEWDKVETYGELPSNGFWKISAVQTDQALYVINSSYVSSNDQKNRINKNIYKLDLSTLSWTKTYELEQEIANYLNKRNNYGVQIGQEWVVFPTDERQEYLAIDPIAGEIKSRKSQEFYSSTRLPLFLDGQWISLRRKKISVLKSEVVIHNYPRTPYDKVIVLRTENELRTNFAMWFFGMLSLMILLWRLIYGTQTFTLNNSTIGRRYHALSLNKGEFFFLKKLAKYGYAKNNELVHFFSEEGKTQDLFVKRKNNMLKELEAKLKAHFKKKLFVKTVDPSDQRHSIYTIAPKIIIHYKN